MVKKRIPKKSLKIDNKPGAYLTGIEEKILGIPEDQRKSQSEKPYIALKYFDPSYECFSAWSPEELKAFSSFNKKLSQLTWQDINKSGGKKGGKTGVAYTVHKDRGKLPDNDALKRISPDLTFFELRVSEKARVHGFRMKSAFFLVWLDRNHQIYPM